MYFIGNFIGINIKGGLLIQKSRATGVRTQDLLRVKQT
jgi:hypothetical protein